MRQDRLDGETGASEASRAPEEALAAAAAEQTPEPAAGPANDEPGGPGGQDGAAAAAHEPAASGAASPSWTSPLRDLGTPGGGEAGSAGEVAAGSAGAAADEPARDAVVLCVANQKGGVGKTTTAVSLAAALALEGAQVLVVDLDPQGNATTGLGLRGREGAPSTYRVLIDQMAVEDATEPTAVRGLHVVPSSLDLAGAEIELVSVFSREHRLRQAIDEVRDLYDVVLIDCPPSLGLLTINALVATDQVVVPIQCEYYALEGLGQLMRTLELVKGNLNNDLELGGVVLTMYDARTRLAQQVADEVRGHFGDTVFDTVIPRTVRLSEAPGFGQPINVFDPSSRGARAYQRLGAEVVARLGLELTAEVAPEDGLSALDRLLGSVAANEADVDLADDRAPAEDAPPAGLPTDLDPDTGSSVLAERREGDAQSDEVAPSDLQTASTDLPEVEASPAPAAQPDRLRDAATAALSSYVTERNEEPLGPPHPRVGPSASEGPGAGGLDAPGEAHASEDPVPASTSAAADPATPQATGQQDASTGAAPWSRPPDASGEGTPGYVGEAAGGEAAESGDRPQPGEETPGYVGHAPEAQDAERDDEQHEHDGQDETPDTASDDHRREERPSSWWR